MAFWFQYYTANFQSPSNQPGARFRAAGHSSNLLKNMGLKKACPIGFYDIFLGESKKVKTFRDRLNLKGLNKTFGKKG